MHLTELSHISPLPWIFLNSSTTAFSFGEVSAFVPLGGGGRDHFSDINRCGMFIHTKCYVGLYSMNDISKKTSLFYILTMTQKITEHPSNDSKSPYMFTENVHKSIFRKPLITIQG